MNQRRNDRRQGGAERPVPRAGEIYFEHYRIGAYARVSAIDAATGVEVTIMGPAAADPDRLEDVALRKLQKRLERGNSSP